MPYPWYNIFSLGVLGPRYKQLWSSQSTSPQLPHLHKDLAIDGEYKSGGYWMARLLNVNQQWIEVDFGQRKGVYRVILFGR